MLYGSVSTEWCCKKHLDFLPLQPEHLTRINTTCIMWLGSVPSKRPHPQYTQTLSDPAALQRITESVCVLSVTVCNLVVSAVTSKELGVGDIWGETKKNWQMVCTTWTQTLRALSSWFSPEMSFKWSIWQEFVLVVNSVENVAVNLGAVRYYFKTSQWWNVLRKNKILPTTQPQSLPLQ